MSLTSAQQEAVTARGNVLVVAGAGAGKTSTLVARCLHCLLDEKAPVSLDGLLLVTFTDAAAADMRKKIRAELEKKIRELERVGTDANTEGSDGTPLPLEGRGSNASLTQGLASGLTEAELRDTQRRVWLTEQLALFETAHIGTLHSFCLELVREHFYELELDPQLTVMSEEEQHLQAEETLNKIVEGRYASDAQESKAVQELLQTQGRGPEKPIRELTLKLHHYAQTLRDPAGWFAGQLAMFESAQPAQWAEWLVDGVQAWRERWLLALRAEAGNSKAAECAAILESLSGARSRAECATVIENVLAADRQWPSRQKTALRKSLEDFFEEAKFLYSVARPQAAPVQSPRKQEPTLIEKAAALVSSSEAEGAADEAEPDFGKLWEAEGDSPAGSTAPVGE